MKLKNGIFLFITAAIWGVAFVAQSVGMDYVGPLTFNCVRSLLGGLVLVPLCLFMGRGRGSAGKNGQDRGERCPAGSGGTAETLLAGGLCCGLALCLASNFQQFGIQYTTVGKAGFITACYIVIVPVIWACFSERNAAPSWLWPWPSPWRASTCCA